MNRHLRVLSFVFATEFGVAYSTEFSAVLHMRDGVDIANELVGMGYLDYDEKHQQYRLSEKGYAVFRQTKAAMDQDASHLHLFACTEDNPREVTTILLTAENKDQALKRFVYEHYDELRNWGVNYARQIDEVDGYRVVLVPKPKDTSDMEL